MNANPQPAASVFEAHRAELTGLAHRMTGSISEAEDLVQDAFVRFDAVADTVEHPRAFLHRIVARLCLDHLKSARHRRETYVGPWLPEPVAQPVSDFAHSAVELADEVAVALLLALERLSPLERAVFVLHDAFDYDYDELATLLDSTAAACRQLASRARAHLRSARPRFRPDPDEVQRLLQAVLGAALAGDAARLETLLRADATLISDGGGKAKAALKSIGGAERIARFLTGTLRKNPLPPGARMVPARISGLPGLLVFVGDVCVQSVAVEFDGGSVAAIYIVRNPDKLAHIRWNATG
jgi:RNA polymerase sigma-70 factor (ECF subfamily)